MSGFSVRRVMTQIIISALLTGFVILFLPHFAAQVCASCMGTSRALMNIAAAICCVFMWPAMNNPQRRGSHRRRASSRETQGAFICLVTGSALGALISLWIVHIAR